MRKKLYFLLFSIPWLLSFNFNAASVVPSIPPDSLAVDTNFHEVYIQTEKKFYFMKNAEIETVSSVISADEIFRCTENEIESHAIILKISEKDFKMLDAVELNKLSGAYYNGEIIPKNDLSKYIRVDQNGSTKAKHKKKSRSLKGLKVGSIISFILSISLGLLALAFYNESHDTDEGGCGGVIVATTLFAIAAILAYTAGVLLIIALAFLIVYLAKK